MIHTYVIRKTENSINYVLDYAKPVEALYFAIFKDVYLGEFSEIDYSSLENRMLEVIDTLTEREKIVLLCRYGFFGKFYTLEEIGRSFLGLTGERVRQIEKKALRKLRHPCRNRHIKPICSDKKNEISVKVILLDNNLAIKLANKRRWSYSYLLECVRKFELDVQYKDIFESHLSGENVEILFTENETRNDLFEKYIVKSTILIKTEYGYRERRDTDIEPINKKLSNWQVYLKTKEVVIDDNWFDDDLFDDD